jgi:hypothetical protein
MHCPQWTVAVLTISQPREHPNRRPRWKEQETRTQKRIMSEKKDTDSIRISQVLAGALAAITAAVLGSTMGVAGTVIGAGLASVVSTVGGALYLRSIQRTRQGVRTVRAKVVGRNGTTSVLVADLEEKPEAEAEQADAEETEAEEKPAEETKPPVDRRLRWPVLVAGSVLAFALGMVVITGIEWVKGEPLSGGTGTSIGDVLERPAQQQQDNDRAPETSSSTPPPTSTEPTSTTTTPPTSSTTPPTTTTTTGSSTTTTTTTTTGEATTTTTTPPPG